MAGPKSWDLGSCERVELGLTEREPVRAGAYVYRRTQPLIFDAHYELELGIVLRGRMVRSYRGWSATLGPGEAWLTGPWEPHTGRVVAAPCEVAVAVVLPQFLADLRLQEAPGLDWMAPFVAAPRERPRVPHARRAEVLGLARRMRALAGAPHDAPGRIRLRLWLIETLLALGGSRDRRASSGATAGAQTGDTYASVSRAVELVLSSRRPVDAAEAARLCAMSRSRFDRVFAATMGTSFARFELARRLHGAARQLAETDAPLKAVAAAWGFADASHLSRRFAALYGTSPGEYRGRAGTSTLDRSLTGPKSPDGTSASPRE